MSNPPYTIPEEGSWINRVKGNTVNTAEYVMDGGVLASSHKPIVTVKRRWQPRVSLKKRCLI